MPRNKLIDFRQGTAAAWTSTNPVLASGEPGFETDTGKLKIGDGVSVWTSLDYSTLTPSQLSNTYAPLPSAYDYLITLTSSGGCQAINGATGAVDYSTTSTTDHAPVFQSAIDNLLDTSGPTGGAGGQVRFAGQFYFASQLVMKPAVALAGAGLTGTVPSSTPYGSIIWSTYNGSCIVVTGVTEGTTFPYMSGFLLRGNSGASQNGIEWNASGGSLRDCLIDNVAVFYMGLSGYLLNDSNFKLQMHSCYAEYNGTAITHSAGYLMANNFYIANNTNVYDGSANTLTGASAQFCNGWVTTNSGFGFKPLLNGKLSLENVTVDTCGSYAFYNNVGVVSFSIVGCTFTNNGSSSVAPVYIDTPGTSEQAVITGCVFYDSRGGSAATNFVNLQNTFLGSITGNSFYGSQSDAVVAGAHTNNRGFIANNKGFNDTKGKLSTPFNTTNTKIGLGGTASAPTASTTYTANYTSLYVVASGGTGVSITVADPAANTAQSGLTSFSGLLPAGYTINFGAFSVAPTVYVGVT